MPRVRVTRTRRFRITDSVIIEDAKDHWDAHVQAYAVQSPIDVEKLEQGVVPWVKPWSSDPMSLPMNVASGHVYSGSNVLLLWMAMMAGYRLPRFMAFKQALDLGAMVRKGEHGFRVTKYGATKIEDGSGKEGKEKAIPFLKVYTVFNVEQIDGLPDAMLAVPEPKPLPERIDDADAFVQATGAIINHGYGRAAYSPTFDEIVMPDGGDFDSCSAYYATLLHELVHWTGHKKRLDRFSDKTDTEVRGPSYAFEELVAELGAAFLCAALGIPGQLQHAEYIGHWIEHLKDNPKANFEAGRLASRAADYLSEIGEAVALPAAA